MDGPPPPAVSPPDGIDVRPASPNEFVDVMRLVDGALLQVDAEAVNARIEHEDVLVAVYPSTGMESGLGSGSAMRSTTESGSASESESESASESEPTASDRVVGAVVVERTRNGDHIEAIAVHTQRRSRGIGSALLRAAMQAVAERGGTRLTATFDPALRPFYTALGFEIVSDDGDDDDRDRTGGDRAGGDSDDNDDRDHDDERLKGVWLPRSAERRL